MSTASSGVWKEITPDDDNDLPNGVTRGIYVGVSGNLDAISEDGDDVTFVGISAGYVHSLRVRRVLETSTAASLIAVY